MFILYILKCQKSTILEKKSMECFEHEMKRVFFTFLNIAQWSGKLFSPTNVNTTRPIKIVFEDCNRKVLLASCHFDFNCHEIDVVFTQ